MDAEVAENEAIFEEFLIERNAVDVTKEQLSRVMTFLKHKFS